jgi:GT2 family glycosyltransferase
MEIHEPTDDMTIANILAKEFDKSRTISGISPVQYQNNKLSALSDKNHLVLEDITIIIPTLGRSILEESLYWIANGSAWPGALVVVQQGTSASTFEWIKNLQSLGMDAEIIVSSQRGRAAGVNLGFEHVKTPFVAVTDDDCFVANDWLANMTARLRQNPISIVTGRVETAGTGVPVAVTSQKPAVYLKPRLKFDTSSGGNLGTSLAVIDVVGSYDEDPRLYTAEDGEWAYRALRAGIPIIYAPEVCVVHYGWRDLNQRHEQYRNYAYSHGGFYGKYIRKGDWFIALRAIVHYLRTSRRYLKGLLNGDRELMLYSQAYLAGLLPGIIAGIRQE